MRVNLQANSRVRSRRRRMDPVRRNLKFLVCDDVKPETKTKDRLSKVRLLLEIVCQWCLKMEGEPFLSVEYLSVEANRMTSNNFLEPDYENHLEDEEDEGGSSKRRRQFSLPKRHETTIGAKHFPRFHVGEYLSVEANRMTSNNFLEPDYENHLEDEEDEGGSSKRRRRFSLPKRHERTIGAKHLPRFDATPKNSARCRLPVGEKKKQDF
ncbi:hypothetical protein QYM36_011532 [Artemia franciscana]|uniref:Uncharacterized protein n=1 Tax=Artemia franciscana TaxID=6661 RepID=A0AA88HPQ4_ARTSF|nr:hypothetical protein QYM36_011532 [Artemia franciscana]